MAALQRERGSVGAGKETLGAGAGRGRRRGAEGPRQPRPRSVAERPRQFLLRALEAVRAARRGEAAMPSVLDEADVEVVFRMLDAAGRGFVTGRQCRAGRSRVC